MNELIEELESLRISDSDFFGKPFEIQFAYEKANDKLDECLDIVYKYFQEHKVV